MAGDMQVIWVKRECKYFCEGGLDRQHQIDPVQQIVLSAQGGLTQRIAIWMRLATR
jgi:hypothetical protein